MVSGTNHLLGTAFSTSPLTTDSAGQVSYTAIVPVCAANGAYEISFVATKAGYVSSPPVVRQVQVSQAANRKPSAPPGQITGQPSVLRIGEVYSISADYTDPDGSNDVQFCFFGLDHPTTPLAFYYDTKTTTVQPLTTNLDMFISPVNVQRSDIPNGFRLTWSFFLKGAWPLASNQVAVNIAVQDRCGLLDGWNSDGSTRTFQTPAYGSTFIIHGYQSFLTPTVPEWVRTMGSRVARRLGNGAVFEYRPGSCDFILLPQHSVGTNATYEKVFLFNWADESDDLSTGYPEAAADAFVAALVRLQLANPSHPFLNRVHVIGHSRGCIVASEMIERLRALSTSGEDTNLFSYPVDTQIDTTFLDPHTTGSEFINTDFGDPDTNLPYLTNRGVVVWKNVGRANNYYQDQNDASLLVYLNGEYIQGSRNRNLDSPTLVGIDHSEVHAWYFGTIDPEATQDEIAAMIAEERAIQAESLQAFGVPAVQRSRAQEADAILASVTIQRPQWYLDGKGLTEGYAHTRPGGEVPHNEVREPQDNAPKVEAFHDLIIDGIFNGNFNHGEGQIVDLPGWDRHGGGGSGSRGSAVLVLDTYGTSRRHNLLLVPSSAEKMYLRMRIKRADVRPVPTADRFVTWLGSVPIIGGPGNEFWLNHTSSFHEVTCLVPPALRGTASTLSVEIVPGGSSANAEVWIDDITWVDRTYLTLVPAPLPGGQMLITMRGKLASRYAIEASSDLSSWSPLAVVTNTTGTIRYTNSITPGAKFYRAFGVP